MVELYQIDSIFGSPILSGPEMKLKRRVRNFPNHHVAILIEIGGQQLSVKNNNRLHEIEGSWKAQRDFAVLLSLLVVSRMG